MYLRFRQLRVLPPSARCLHLGDALSDQEARDIVDVSQSEQQTFHKAIVTGLNFTFRPSAVNSAACVLEAGVLL
ncbi:MAG: hypothetical protein ACI9XZ_004342 [Alphaproteobacteria bacterium]|jgi:hypothetical protein